MSDPAANNQKGTATKGDAQPPATTPSAAINCEKDYPSPGNSSGRPDQTESRRHTLLEKIAFFVALVAAGGTAYQAYVANDTETHSLRAYLGLPENALVINKNEGAWNLQIINGGQTPAHNITGRLNMAWKEGENQVPQDFSFADIPGRWSDYSSQGYVLPQKSLTMKFALRNLDIIEKSKMGGVLLIVYGHVDYFDIFGAKQWCQFAYYSVPSSAEFGTHIQLNRHNDCS